ncbi:MAG: cytochrome c biogenesis protein CcdA [Candidatus Margulisiibacteriota bacterium]|nr:cytochrome c biogenesis protein CcdA [Candidatus Margulisiibacteriota bacterium]
MIQNINLFIAFSAGFLTFFSPCFLPLVPVYLVYITGLSSDDIKNIRVTTVFHSLCFILGFTIVFTLLGMAASIIGQLIYQYSDILRIFGGFLIILFGLYLTGILKLSFLNIEKKITLSSKPTGYLGSVLVGMVFALGWSPCVGPVLGGILVFASQADTVFQGMALLISFSLGLGLPLFLVSLAVNYFISFMKKIEKYLGAIHFALGLLLVIIGMLLVTNNLQLIVNWFIGITGYQGI